MNQPFASTKAVVEPCYIGSLATRNPRFQFIRARARLDGVFRRTFVVVLAASAALLGSSHAAAAEQTLTFTSKAISVEGFGVAQAPLLLESPKVDGFVVAMQAEIVDERGEAQGRDKVMLHHI